MRKQLISQFLPRILAFFLSISCALPARLPFGGPNSAFALHQLEPTENTGLEEELSKTVRNPNSLTTWIDDQKLIERTTAGLEEKYYRQLGRSPSGEMVSLRGTLEDPWLDAGVFLGRKKVGYVLARLGGFESFPDERGLIRGREENKRGLKISDINIGPSDINDYVEDDPNRGRGIGTLVIRGLIQEGIERGMTSFYAEVGNPRILRILRRNNLLKNGMVRDLWGGREAGAVPLDIFYVQKGVDQLAARTHAVNWIVYGQLVDAADLEEVSIVDFVGNGKYAAGVLENQRGLAQRLLNDGAITIAAGVGKSTFQLVTDSDFAVAAHMNLNKSSIEGVQFIISGELRTEQNFQGQGLIVPSQSQGPFERSGISLRILDPISQQQMNALTPLAWIALNLNRNLTVDQVLNLHLFFLTSHDEQGRTIHAVFA